jgi:hypothetical protein
MSGVMRTLATTLLVVPLLGHVQIGSISAATATLAQASGGECKGTRSGSGYLCPWGFVERVEGETPRSGPSGTPAASRPRVVYADTRSVGPDGEPCLRRTAIPLPEGTSLGPGTDFGDIGGSLLNPLSACPPEPGEEAVIDPRVLAQQGWEEVLLPKPQPYIAPGWAITGKYAYLETRGELRDVFRKATPIGPLEITSTGRYYVDWGDGERTGPHSVEGRG